MFYFVKRIIDYTRNRILSLYCQK